MVSCFGNGYAGTFRRAFFCAFSRHGMASYPSGGGNDLFISWRYDKIRPCFYGGGTFNGSYQDREGKGTLRKVRCIFPRAEKRDNPYSHAYGGMAAFDLFGIGDDREYLFAQRNRARVFRGVDQRGQSGDPGSSDVLRSDRAFR